MCCRFGEALAVASSLLAFWRLRNQPRSVLAKEVTETAQPREDATWHR